MKKIITLSILLSFIYPVLSFGSVSNKEDKRNNNPDVENKSVISPLEGNVAFLANEDGGKLLIGYTQEMNGLTFGLNLTTPFDSKSDKDSPIVSNDGLTNATKFGISSTYFFGKPNYNAHRRAAHEAIFREAAKALGKDYPEVGVIYNESYLENLKGTTTYHDLKKRYDNLTQDVLAFHLPFFGVSGELGRRDYRFVDPVTAQSDSVTKTDYLISAHTGVLTKDDWLLLARYSYASVHGGQGSTFCSPINGTNNLICNDNVLISGPYQSNENIVSGEIRKYFDNGIGINPTAFYNFDKDKFGISLGIYSKLTELTSHTPLMGGVKGEWNSEEDDFTVSAVLSVPFDLTPDI